MERTTLDFLHGNTLKPRLDGMPPELLRNIFDHIGTDAKASVALCNHALFKSIGTRCFGEFPNLDQRRDRARFLITLQRDLGDWLFCQHCEKLRRRVELNPNIDCLKDVDSQEPPCVLAAGAVSIVPGFKLSFQFAQNLMDYHRVSCEAGDLKKHQDVKHYHIQLHELSYEATMTAPRESDRLKTLRVSCNAQICANDLIFKTQCQISELPSGTSTKVWHNIPSVCPHITVLHARHDIPSMLSCQVSHIDEEGLCDRCGGLQNCKLCHTEFMIETELRRAPVPHIAKITITAWKNLGSLYSLTDARWTSQLEPPYQRRDNYDTFKRGSFREAFESQERAGK